MWVINLLTNIATALGLWIKPPHVGPWQLKHLWHVINDPVIKISGKKRNTKKLQLLVEFTTANKSAVSWQKLKHVCLWSSDSQDCRVYMHVYMHQLSSLLWTWLFKNTIRHFIKLCTNFHSESRMNWCNFHPLLVNMISQEHEEIYFKLCTFWRTWVKGHCEFKSCELGISSVNQGILIKSGTDPHLDLKANWLGFGGQ